MINRGKTAYDPNSLNANDPRQAKVAEGGFASFYERIEASKIRARSQSFTDHFSQAAMFFHSQSEFEQKHIINALRFELGKVEAKPVRERMLYLLSQIDEYLAKDVAAGLGMPVPKKIKGELNANFGADADPKDVQPEKFTGKSPDSPPLSIIRSAKPGMKTAKVAVLLADGFDEAGVDAIKQAVTAAGGMAKVIAPHGGTVTGAGGTELPVDFSLPTVASVLFDAVYVAGGEQSVETIGVETRAIEFVEEAYKHCKAIAGTGAAVVFLKATRVSAGIADQDVAVCIGEDSGADAVASAFVEAISQHRNWDREAKTLPNG
jgi:catalase